MTAATIHLLAKTIPDRLMPTLQIGGRTSNFEGGGLDPDTQRFLLQYRSLNFGWQYAQTAARHPDEVPVLASYLSCGDQVVFRAYLYHRFGYAYEDISGAKALLTSTMSSTRAMLEGLLICSDATLENSASRCGLPLPVVRAYEKLFFNILDRKEDISFIQHVVYPHGRMIEMVDGYLFSTPLGDIIRRAGYTNGANDVRYLMGAAPDAVAALEQAGDSRKLESLILSLGMVMARNGGLHQPGLPGVSHARQIITAGKLGGNEADEHPLSSDMQSVLLNEVKQFAKRMTPVAAA